MKISYDPAGDVLTIRLRDGLPSDSEQMAPGLIVDYDRDSNLLGFEIFSVSKRKPAIDLEHLEIQIPPRRGEL